MMENNEELLNEERYQKTNKKVNKVGTLLLIIGGLMVISAIAIIVIEFAILDKPMLLAIAGPIFVFGFTFLGFGGQLKFFGHARDISAYLTQQQMPIAKEGIEKIAPSVSVAAKEITKGIKEGLKDEEDK